MPIRTLSGNPQSTCPNVTAGYGGSKAFRLLQSALQPRAEDWSMPESHRRPWANVLPIRLTVAHAFAPLRIFPNISQIARPLPAFLPRASVTSMRQGATRQATAVPWSVWVLAILCAIPELASARGGLGAVGLGAMAAAGLHARGVLGRASRMAGRRTMRCNPWRCSSATPGCTQAPATSRATWPRFCGLARRLWRVGAMAACFSSGACPLLGGGAAFGLLTSSPAPMVGASGALFGLAAEWVVAEVRRARPGPGRCCAVLASSPFSSC